MRLGAGKIQKIARVNITVQLKRRHFQAVLRRRAALTAKVWREAFAFAKDKETQDPSRLLAR
jgi:hypothetical protein